MRQADKADYARQTGLRRGRDIDFLRPYDAFSPHSLQDGDADEWSEEEELGDKTPDSLLSPSLVDQPGYLSSCNCYDLQHILSHTSVHQWGTRPISPRRTPEQPWDVTVTTSDLTFRHYWCAPSACEVDLEVQDLPSGGYAYRRLMRCWLPFRQRCRAFSTTAAT